MQVEYINDTGSRHEWECVCSELRYLVTFHYIDGTWSAQRIRDDGEREVLKSSEAEALLSEFPREKALKLIRSESKSRPLQTKFTDAVEAELDMPNVDEGPLDLGSSERKEEDEKAGPDRPSA